MIIYNVTINVEEDINEDWLKWMKESHIPEVLETGCFTHHYFTRVLSTQADETGFTYSIQYHCKSRKVMDTYNREFAPQLQKDHLDRYENKFVAFRTILEKV